jgi:DnaK suppressor protein
LRRVIQKQRRDIMPSIKSVLEMRRRALRNAIHATLDSTRDENADLEMSKDPLGTAGLTHDREIAAAVVERRVLELKQVTRALENIESGRHGICRTCGEPIPSARLKVIPFAIRCVACQAALESARRAS